MALKSLEMNQVINLVPNLDFVDKKQTKFSTWVSNGQAASAAANAAMNPASVELETVIV